MYGLQKALIVVLLVVGANVGFVGQAHAQDPTGSTESPPGGFRLLPNRPNPFNPETTIPFVLDEALFEEGRPVVVSMRIFNVLSQPVAQPVALNHPLGPDAVMESIQYTAPGMYEAFWDGRDTAGRQVASGVYILQLTVNGRPDHLRMFVAK